MNERIRQLRLSLNLSQAEFGKRVGLTQNYIWMVEKGSRVPSEKSIASICREFNICEEWLETGNGEMWKVEKREPFKARLMAALACLDEEEWKLLEKIISKVR